MSMFRITSGKGFHITFENGYTVSVQFGPGSYCENRNLDYIDFNRKPRNSICESPDAEVAVWDDKGAWVTQRAWDSVHKEALNDQVVGHLNTDEVLKIMNWAASQKTGG